MAKPVSDTTSDRAKSAGQGTSRASSLDALKCFAAFFVVCIHYGDDWQSPIVRCAVPLFFVITGYYYPTMTRKGTFWKHVRKLLVMAICASALYGAYELQRRIGLGSVGKWADKTFQTENLVNWIAFNADLFSPHLWYFYSALYCLVVLHFADKWRLTRWLRYAIPLLLLVHFARNFTPLPKTLVRNFLFMGLPCMMIGRCIRENKDGAFRFLSSQRYLWAYSLGSLLLVCGEMRLLSFVCSDNGVREMYVFTLPMILPWFYWALRHPRFGEGSLAATTGRKYSALIYIFHILIGRLLQENIMPKDSFWLSGDIFPFIVFAISLCLAWLFVQLLQWAKRRSNNQR